jgi:hypothetical protein
MGVRSKPRVYCSLLAYCTARFGRSNFVHQMPPRLPTRSALYRRKLELMGGNKDRKFCLNADFHGTFRVLLHAAHLQHGTHGFTFVPKKGVLRIFPPLKTRRLLPGLNPRTLVPEASTLTARPPKALSQIHTFYINTWISLSTNLVRPKHSILLSFIQNI